ncbi:MAG: hypothetical protein Q9159_002903 [Coniocarpon cinnabarinum]
MICSTPPQPPSLSSRPVTSAAPPSAWDSNRSSMVKEEWDHSPSPTAVALGHSLTQRPSSSVSGQGPRRSTTQSTSSTQPFFTPPAKPPAQKPNKLVKRSLSQNVSGTSKHRDSFPQKPLFRRPATSHQRAASWALNVDGRAEGPNAGSNPLPSPNTSSQSSLNQPYIHFPRIVRARKKLKGFSRQTADKDSEPVRRIQPDGSKLTLLFAKFVIPAQVELEDTYHVESDIESPYSPSSRQRHSPTTSSSPLNPSSAQSSLRSERHRHQSFAQFRHSPTRMMSSSQTPTSRLKRKLSQRISSAPTSFPSTVDPPVRIEQRSSPREPATPRPDSAYLPSNRSSSVIKKSASSNPTPYHTRQVSMSSAPSSSPDGSSMGQRVFSWGEGEEEGSTSETIYDSFRTGTTRSSYGTARQPLETLFDKSSTTVNDHPRPRSPAHRPLERLSQQTLGTDDAKSFVSAQATPRTMRPQRSTPSDQLSWTTPPDLNEDFADDEADWDSFPISHKTYTRSPVPSTNAIRSELSSSPNDFGRAATPRADTGLRNSVFDWSEPTPLDKGSDHDTPPRPKTVHGKKRQGALGTQSSARRPQAGLHARSQSVPAFQDLTGRRPDVTQKFGTWGVGGKGATEDWDDDFDFGHPSQSSPIVPSAQINEVADNFTAMRIPDSIQQQQNNVLANIGLLKEWGLLIEELKDLRVRAAALGIRAGNHANIFDEVDAMIDLADQEHEDDALSTLRSPSSSYFSDEEHERNTPPRNLPAGHARMSPSEMLRAVQRNNSVNSSPNFGNSNSPDPAVHRPRKDSEAVAQSVIQALQRGRQRNIENDPAVNSALPRPKKMPFDTNTLKHIVPHVNSLMRQVKQLIKDEEGLHTSPKADRHASFSRRISAQHGRATSPSAQRELRLRLQRRPNERSDAAMGVNAHDLDLEEQLRAMEIN